MEKATLNVAINDRDDDVCEIKWERASGIVSMVAEAASTGVLTIEAANLFEALVKLRLELERYGCLLLCNAARKDAYPSRMLLEMGGGRKVYLLHQGKQALKEDIVDVLGSVTREQVGTVQEQRAEYEKWLRSL